MNKTGFALLSKDQLELLYGKESPFADTEVLKKNNKENMKYIFKGFESIYHFG